MWGVAAPVIFVHIRKLCFLQIPTLKEPGLPSFWPAGGGEGIQTQNEPSLHEVFVAVNCAELTQCARCCVVFLRATACSFYCRVLPAAVSADSFAASHLVWAKLCRDLLQFGAHGFDAHMLDAQCFATLLCYTISIQLHYNTI